MGYRGLANNIPNDVPFGFQFSLLPILIREIVDFLPSSCA